MKRPKSRHASSPGRRAGILRAALACFTESGIAGTGIADIQERAGVSVGSLYHHFGSKENLAATLYLEGIRDYQGGIVAIMKNRGSAREGIHAIVRYHLSWVKKNDDWARFLFRERHADFMGDAGGEIAAMNRDFIDSMGRWISHQVQSGELRPASPDLFACMVLGPCQEYARLYLAGARVTPIERAVREMGSALWCAMGIPDKDGTSMNEQSR